MVHAGLPWQWAALVAGLCGMVLVRTLLATAPMSVNQQHYSLRNIPGLGALVAYLNRQLWLLLALKILFAAVFLLIIFAGLFGTSIAERNLATELTWNLWWVAIVFAVFFLGTSWCAICPWDNIANFIVRFKIWRRSPQAAQLQLRLPKNLRSLWPATILFAGLTWFELGLGITADPQATARLALLMLLACIAAVALLETKSFCRYLCPVGRTIGVYSQLSPWALRHHDPKLCASCESLDCYHGSEHIEACPMQLVVGRLQENTYCLSCANCTQSCPQQNVNWSLRVPTVEAVQVARPHLDEAGFMLCLLALTGFHGLTMMPFWPDWVSHVGVWLNDSGSLLWSFSVLINLSLLATVGLYVAAVYALGAGTDRAEFSKRFSGFAFACIPLSFAYHLAHNLTHLVREGADWSSLLSNPLGLDTVPLSMMEKHQRHMTLLIPEQLMFAFQAGLMVLGFYVAVLVIKQRGYKLFGMDTKALLPMYGFAMLISSYHMAMLMQDMVMRM